MGFLARSSGVESSADSAEVKLPDTGEGVTSGNASSPRCSLSGMALFDQDVSYKGQVQSPT